MRKRVALAGAAAVTAAAALLLGGLLRGAPAAQAPVAAAALETGFGTNDTPALIRQLQSQLRARPDEKGFALLGLAYQQRARETGDPSWYPKSEVALRRSAPGDLLAIQGLASLALSRHRFSAALALGRRALRISPTTARNYGIVADALVELGRYREAFADFDRMAALKPDLASYARVSYARELRGNIRGARSAMLLARDAAQGQAEPTAWTEWQLGKLAFGHGRPREARFHYTNALVAFPTYVYALDALAALDAAQGRVGAAIALERRAVARIPLPQFVAQLGDLYRVTGRDRLARDQYATVHVIERLFRANGVNADLETALFDADHGHASLALARLAQRERPSIDGDDVLAWTLARDGRCAEALPWSRRALRLGTQDALKLFHRAWIANCVGDRAGARAYSHRALALNPHFSLLWSGAAERLAE